MLSALLSFFGGAAFRYLMGRLFDSIEKRLEHQLEMERLKFQEEAEEKRHAREQETIRLQHELGIKEIQVRGAAESDLEAARAFTEAMKNRDKPTGFKLVDAWNGSIRPAAATMALFLWFKALAKVAFVITDWDKDLIAGILGYYFADRTLGKRRGS